MPIRLLILVLFAGFVSEAAAQAVTLNGTWSAAGGVAPPNLAAAPSPVLGANFSLRLDGATVTLTRAGADASMVSVIPLGGAESSSAAPGPQCLGERIFHHTAALEAGALVIAFTGITPPGGGTRSTGGPRYVIRPDGPNRVVVEGTVVQRGQARQVGTVYTRSTVPLPPAPAPLPIGGTTGTIAEVAWIGATWSGTGSSGVMTEERWTSPASGGMIGVSRTLRGTSLAAYEFLCIAERNGTLVYFAMPNGRSPATQFVATQVGPDSVTFENPSHDYPKLIRDRRTADGDLETMIAGAGGERARRITLRRQ